MGLKGIYFVLITLSIYLIQHTDAFPRDSSVTKTETLLESHETASSPVKGSPVQVLSESDVKIPGRVSCPYEEATEYAICQEHCLPKGYSYGICVSETCSCI
ncbi:uncharacterized protein LOC125077300 [Vanessa atalanta]|uniref:uncharacterized protein LOC125077300 n=1 Tax=Vanessa atalanta TaxID=42275 RepID=UPI001FCD5283|nr:uncharacterized protein LOC125077300 [Vanessa atalanta]